nr:MAG TPA_asm: putative tail-component [Caudoviricetes sp.]
MTGFQVLWDGVQPLLAKLEEKSQADFLGCCKRATLLLRNNARKKTPVAESTVYKNRKGEVIGQHKGGGLRRSLRVSMPSVSSPGEVGYTIHYAPHVEYGHRQKIGRYVPQIGKRLKASFVPGQYFLKDAVEETRPVFQRDIKETLKK